MSVQHYSHKALREVQILMGLLAELGVSSSEVSFSIHFPITCYDEFAKCRQFKRFQSFVSSFPSFGRGFDSHRPLQILKGTYRQE
jgi:hypothetical protein